MVRVLIAPLGESPVVVTGMVRALSEHPDRSKRVVIERVVVLHPDNEMARRGVALIEGVVGTERVRRCPLGRGDVGSREATYEFLATLQKTLDGYRGDDDDVYISCAGGRKSMSALAAAVTQFHPCVRGLYHLLDRSERDSRCPRGFYALDELGRLSRDEQRRAMQPRIDCLDLIEIPFQPLGEMGPIREHVARGLAAQPALVDTASLEAQFRRVVEAADRNQPGGPQTSIEPVLDIAFTPRAREQFQTVRDRAVQDRLWTMFLQMRFPHLLQRHTVPDPMKVPLEAARRTYSSAAGIHVYYRTESAPQDTVHPPHRIVVEALRYPNQPKENTCADSADTTALSPLGDMRAIDGMLIATLGTAPMVVTQTLAMLARKRVRIKGVGLVYPGGDGPLSASTDMIERLCQDEGVEMTKLRGTGRIPVYRFPIEDYDDVDSTEACNACGKTIVAATDEMQRLHPDCQMHLSISGGRKTMVAMGYYAAQLAHLPYVWHTVIADDELDSDVLNDTTLENLENLKTDEERASYLFLHHYADRIDRFSLFEIPVIAN